MFNRMSQWGAIGLLVAVILGLVEAQFHVLRDFFGPGALEHRELATFFLAKHLAATLPGKTAVVLSNPFSLQTGQPREVYQYEKAGIRGLQRGFGQAIVLEQVVFPEIKPEFFKNRKSVPIDPATSTPLSYLVREDSLDSIAKVHPKAEVFVSLIGLPLNTGQTQAWKSGKRFALLLPDLRMLGGQREISAAFKSGRLVAAVFNRPGAPGEDQPLRRDPAIEFEQRFVLVTSENIEQIIKAYPRLF